MEKKGKILIAESNEDVRKVLIDYSAGFEGYETAELDNLNSLKRTLESIASGEEKDVGVIVTNPFKFSHPLLGGEDAIDLIEEYSHKIDVPIIVASGRGNADDFISKGAFAYIRKPFNLQEYEDVVSRALEKSK